jgi:hypothetical protein
MTSHTAESSGGPEDNLGCQTSIQGATLNEPVSVCRDDVFLPAEKGFYKLYQSEFTILKGTSLRELGIVENLIAGVILSFTAALGLLFASVITGKFDRAYLVTLAVGMGLTAALVMLYSIARWFWPSKRAELLARIEKHYLITPDDFVAMPQRRPRRKVQK